MTTMLTALSFSNIVLKQSIFRATRGAATVSLLLLAGNISSFSASSTYPGISSSSLISGIPSFLTTLASSTSNDNESTDISNAEKSAEGKTGWNHNPPKDPDFWNPAAEVEAIAKEIAAEETKTKLRTGWLHNSESADQKRKTMNKNKSSSNDDKSNKKPNAAGLARRRLEEAMKTQRENHRIVSPGALHACGKDRQIVVTEHRMSVPLVHPEIAEETETGRAVAGMPAAIPRMAPPTASIDVAFTIVEEVRDGETRTWYESVFPGLTPTQRAAAYVKRCGMTSAKDMLLFLQGGPGFGAPTPFAALDFSKDGGSWGSAALDRYRRVILMDQRGTGKSSPLTKQSLEKRFPDLFTLDKCNPDDIDHEDNMDSLLVSNPEEFTTFSESLDDATEFMAQFRADSIVRDAELIRKVLMYTPSLADEDEDDFDDTNTDAYDPSFPNPWGCSLGQSFGGFCTMTYLSQIKHPPKISLLTGGIAPMLADSAVDVYSSLWKKVKERNLRYYDMYPGDVVVVKTIVRQLLLAEDKNATPKLPSGGKLTARRFLQLGMMLGGSPSSFATMHELLSSAFLQPLSNKDDTQEFSRRFLKEVDQAQPFDEYPIYFWLHESIYADGNRNHNRINNKKRPRDDDNGHDDGIKIATNWSADSAFESKIAARISSDASEYDYKATSKENSNLPVLFFGEMVFPWMADDYAELSCLGCTALANALAKKEDWGPLYDADHMRAVLKDGRSRSAAAVYYEDMYVDFDQCMKVAARGGPLEKCKVYVTNEYQHGGIRYDGAAIFNKLHGMATGSVRTPS